MSYHKEDIGICKHIVESYYKPNNPISTYNNNETVKIWVDFSRKALYNKYIDSATTIKEYNANT